MKNNLTTKLEKDYKEVNLKINEITKQANEIIIKDDISNVQACELDKTLKDMINQIEDERKKMVQPLTFSIKSFNMFFASKSDKLRMARAAIDVKLNIFFRKKQELQRSLEEKHQKKLEKLEEKRIEKEAKGKSTASIEIKKMEIEAMRPVVETKIKSGDATTSFINFLNYEIINDDAIPREYCSADDKKIKEAIKAGIKEIAGIRIFEDIRKITR